MYRQAEKYFEVVNDAASNLLVNYPYYTFSAQFLISKLERYLRLGTEKELHAENEHTFVFSMEFLLRDQALIAPGHAEGQCDCGRDPGRARIP